MLRSRERGVLIQGLLCSPLTSGGFGGAFEFTGAGYVDRGTSLASLQREGGVLILVALLNAPVRGV